MKTHGLGMNRYNLAVNAQILGKDLFSCSVMSDCTPMDYSMPGFPVLGKNGKKGY